MAENTWKGRFPSFSSYQSFAFSFFTAVLFSPSQYSLSPPYSLRTCSSVLIFFSFPLPSCGRIRTFLHLKISCFCFRIFIFKKVSTFMMNLHFEGCRPFGILPLKLENGKIWQHSSWLDIFRGSSRVNIMNFIYSSHSWQFSFSLFTGTSLDFPTLQTVNNAPSYWYYWHMYRSLSFFQGLIWHWAVFWLWGFFWIRDCHSCQVLEKNNWSESDQYSFLWLRYFNLISPLS